jgi:transposase, IS5 family
MMRTRFLQQRFSLLDPAMEKVLFDVQLYRKFAQFDGQGRLPDESTILGLRRWLECHKLAVKIFATVNALLIDKNSE